MPRSEVPEWLETPWRAWHQLSAGRPHTLTGFAAPMGGMLLKSQPGAIPWLDIAEWCDRHGCGPDDAEWVSGLVTVLDAAYLEWWQGKNVNQ